MPLQTITLELPDTRYRTARKLARVTKRPLAEILQEGLSLALPPLDDVSPQEGEVLAQMSMLDDASLWQVSATTLPEDQQEELHTLLDSQSAGELTTDESVRLQELMDESGRLLVRQSHAWLLLARRGYKVPIQQSQE